MHHSIYNRSAEVVFAKSNTQRETACLEKCLKRLPARERLLLWRIGSSLEVTQTRGLANVHLKKGVAKLKKCLQKCLEEDQDEARA